MDSQQGAPTTRARWIKYSSTLRILQREKGFLSSLNFFSIHTFCQRRYNGMMDTFSDLETYKQRRQITWSPPPSPIPVRSAHTHNISAGELFIIKINPIPWCAGMSGKKRWAPKPTACLQEFEGRKGGHQVPPPVGVDVQYGNVVIKFTTKWDKRRWAPISQSFAGMWG
jgi:hypothetical protein